MFEVLLSVPANLISEEVLKEITSRIDRNRIEPNNFLGVFDSPLAAFDVDNIANAYSEAVQLISKLSLLNKQFQEQYDRVGCEAMSWHLEKCRKRLNGYIQLLIKEEVDAPSVAESHIYKQFCGATVYIASKLDSLYERLEYSADQEDKLDQYHS